MIIRLSKCGLKRDDNKRTASSFIGIVRKGWLADDLKFWRSRQKGREEIRKAFKNQKDLSFKEPGRATAKR